MAAGGGQWSSEPPSLLGLHIPFLKLSQSTLKSSRLFTASPTARLPGYHPSCVLPPTEEVSEARPYVSLERRRSGLYTKKGRGEYISLRKFLESPNCKFGSLFSDNVHW